MVNFLKSNKRVRDFLFQHEFESYNFVSTMFVVHCYFMGISLTVCSRVLLHRGVYTIRVAREEHRAPKDSRE